MFCLQIPSLSYPGLKWRFTVGLSKVIVGFDPEYRQAVDDVIFCWRISASLMGNLFQSDRDRLAFRRFTRALF